MLVEIVASPTRATLWNTRPLGFRRRSDRMLVSRRYRKSAISEIHVLDGPEIIDLRKLFAERIPRRQELQERRPGHRLDDQSVPLLAKDRLVARKLEIPRNTNRLVAPVPEQAHDAFGLHDVLPAAKTRPMRRHMLAWSRAWL